MKAETDKWSKVVREAKTLTGCEIERAYVDKGYRGHNTTNPRRVFISGQKRGVFGAIKRELRRRSAIEAVIARYSWLFPPGSTTDQSVSPDECRTSSE